MSLTMDSFSLPSLSSTSACATDGCSQKKKLGSQIARIPAGFQCTRERGRVGKREGERERGREGERGRERDSESVRGREGERASERARERDRESARGVMIRAHTLVYLHK